MFEMGEQAELRIPVTIVGIEKMSTGWIYRVKFEGFEWSFMVSEKDLKKKPIINLCEHAPFPKCNNAEGCDTCQFNEEN